MCGRFYDNHDILIRYWLSEVYKGTDIFLKSETTLSRIDFEETILIDRFMHFCTSADLMPRNSIPVNL